MLVKQLTEYLEQRRQQPRGGPGIHLHWAETPELLRALQSTLLCWPHLEGSF